MSTLKELHQKVDQVIGNDLPHLGERIAKLEGKVDLLVKISIGTAVGIALLFVK